MGSKSSLETRDWQGRAEGHVGRQIWKGVNASFHALLISISRTTGMGGTPSLPLPPLPLENSSFLPPV